MKANDLKGKEGPLDGIQHTALWLYAIEGLSWSRAKQLTFSFFTMAYTTALATTLFLAAASGGIIENASKAAAIFAEVAEC